MPAASWSGLSATTICMVEQLGLATMPRCAASASGLTSGTTSGTCSCIRQKRRVVDHHGAGLGEARRPLLAGAPTAGGEERDVEALASASLGQLRRCSSSSPPVDPAARPSARTRTAPPRGRERALPQHAEHRRAHGAGGAHDGDARSGMRRPPAGTSSRSSRLEGACERPHRLRDDVRRADHARDLDRRGRDHLDVDAGVAEHGEDTWPRRPGGSSFQLRRATPAPWPGRSTTLREAELVLDLLELLAAMTRSSRGTVNEMSAPWPSVSGSFWMIMSTLTLAAASAVKHAAARRPACRARR